MTITDIHLAELSLAAYSSPATIETPDAHALIVEETDGLIIALRGTDPKKLVDLWLDSTAVEDRHDPILGKTPESFLSDAEQLYWRILPKIKPDQPIYICGHSKGAAEANALAAMFVFAWRAPTRLTVFAPPQMGDLGGYVAALPGFAFRHGDDPITGLPPGRSQPRSLTQLPWVGPKPLDKLKYHDMAGYAEAVKAFAPN